MDVALLVTRMARAHAWRHRVSELSDVQLRVLALINAHPGCAPSALADYILLSRPAVTRVVDQLVVQKLVIRQVAPADRRRVTLRTTAAGRRRVEDYLEGARAALAACLADLTPSQRRTVRRAMDILRPHFRPTPLDQPAPGS
jgi:DNA-binding MarR family transcriptional regulator